MPNTDRPNILLLISDQHSKYHLGCYGDSLIRTPNMDRLAQSGMRLDSIYCASPVCVPSRMSFLSCRTPSRNRVWNNNHILHSGTPTFPHYLGLAGYETALIGRMHFNGHDQHHGFETRPLGEFGAIHPGADRKGAPMFQQIPSGTSGQGRISVECAGRGYTAYHSFDEIVAEATSKYLNQKAQDSGDRPFAAVAGFLLPHCPFFAHKELFDYYYDRVDVPTHDASEPAAIRRFKQIRGLYPPIPEERIRIARAAYFGMCEYLDQQVGRILQTLDDTGLAQNTLVIYCSDHGEMAGEHGCWWKSSYYEGSVGVPLVARLPGVIPPATSSDLICNLMDLGPTLVDLAGGEPMAEVDGTSLWPTLTGSSDSSHPNEAFSEHLGQEGIPSRMIRTGPWKCYTYHDNTPPVLYNLQEDPGEVNDLGGDSKYEAIRNELLGRIHEEWDPEYVLAEAAELNRDISVLTRWGNRIQPRLNENLAIPENAEDVEIL